MHNVINYFLFALRCGRHSRLHRLWRVFSYIACLNFGDIPRITVLGLNVKNCFGPKMVRIEQDSL